MQSYKYEGVEFRLGKKHLHGVELDSGADYLADVRKQLDDANAAVACLATSFAFSSTDIVDRRKNIENTKQALRVAEALGAPFVRVFGGEVPAGMEVAGIVDYVSDSLSELAEYCETNKVRSTVVVETTGAFSHTKYMSEVMEQIVSPKIAVLWDVMHPLRVLEQADDTFDALGHHVRHVHVHDAEYNEDRTRIKACDPGEGFVPMSEIVDLLKAGLFRGYLSLEVINREVDPDTVLPQWADYLRATIKGKAKVEA
jgi:sugar phosphate isomerase/epimerase